MPYLIRSQNRLVVPQRPCFWLWRGYLPSAQSLQILRRFLARAFVDTFELQICKTCKRRLEASELRSRDSATLSACLVKTRVGVLKVPPSLLSSTVGFRKECYVRTRWCIMHSLTASWPEYNRPGTVRLKRGGVYVLLAVIILYVQ